jgi:predicted DNA-binding transcriptional regulator YafY
MSKPDHETVASRLASILLKLNQGESFNPQELAGEFGVHERTIYRDLNRFAGIVERSTDG